MIETLRALSAKIETIPSARPMGYVASANSGLIEVSGLNVTAKLGDWVEIHSRNARLHAEVVKITADSVFVLSDSLPKNIALKDKVILKEQPEFRPSDQWLGRVVDPFGRPIDGRPFIEEGQPVDVLRDAPEAARRRGFGCRLSSGLAVMNTFLPVVRGQRIGLFAGSGVGKSVLLEMLAKTMRADVVVFALVGERGREVSDLAKSLSEATEQQKWVLVAATSDRPATERRRCIWSAMAVAEYFRDQGRNVLFLADSMTRFAEAHREVAANTGELPSLRGFPPSVSALMAAVCERAGPGVGAQGDITAILSVLVAGGDTNEPVADMLRGFLDGHVMLDRDIAERGRFPAINVLKSVSRSLPGAATKQENDVLSKARELLAIYELSETMITSGLYQAGSNSKLDQAIAAWPELDAFVARCQAQSVDDSFDQLRLILRRANVQI